MRSNIHDGQPWMATHIKNLITERQKLSSSDIKSGNEKKATTTASKIEIAKYGGKR